MRISGTAVVLGAVLLVGAAVVAVVMLNKKAAAPAKAATPAAPAAPAPGAKAPSTADQVLGWGAVAVGIAGAAHNAGLF